MLFVYRGAWWPVQTLWAALELVLIVRGGGMILLDAITGAQSRR